MNKIDEIEHVMSCGHLADKSIISVLQKVIQKMKAARAQTISQCQHLSMIGWVIWTDVIKQLPKQ